MINPALLPRLRALLESMGDDVTGALRDLGLDDYRPRYSAVIRPLRDHGPMTISAVAAALDVTHSAASQTITEMERRGLVRLRPGRTDARQRMVTLAPRARRALPAIEAEWAATAAASAALEAELPYPLSQLLDDLAAALATRGFRDRIADAARELPVDPDADPTIRETLSRG